MHPPQLIARLIVFFLTSLCIAAGGMVMAEPFIEDDFADWASVPHSGTGTWTERGWRMFTVGGAVAAFETVDTPDGRAIRITRENQTGDTALDRDGADLRALVNPGDSLFARVWARSAAGPATLSLRIPEFEGNTWTGRDNPHLFPLSGEFQPCLARVTTSPQTTEVNLALRVEGTGSIEILRAELGRVESVAGTRPRILLPQGRTPNERPLLWWRSRTSSAFQIQLADDDAFAAARWDSGTSEKSATHAQLPALPPNTATFARVRVRDLDGVWSEWSGPTVVVYSPLPRLPPRTLVVYDLNPTRSLSPAEAFEQAHFVAALQGLVNRSGPRLYLRWKPSDDFWLERLRQPGRWMEHVEIESVNSLEALIARFAGELDGVALWDPAVAATSNVASTVAGAEDLLPVPLRDVEGSLYRRLVTGGPHLPVRRSLVGMFTGSGTIPDIGDPSSGSAKNDAYRWAIARYMETGKCSPARSGYYIDAYWIKNPAPGGDYSNHTLTNHDFFILHRGFLWDLNVWGDEKPVDDPEQPMGTDLETVKRLFRAAATRLAPGEMIHCAGFTPWSFKYTTHGVAGGTHDPVPTEWETTRILSAYDAILDADALGLGGMANASVWWHMPRPEQSIQPPPPTREDCIENGWLDVGGAVVPRAYVIQYVGDYDSAAWLNTYGIDLWNDFRRGEITIPWAWNPNLMERGMAMFDEFLRTRTPRDFIWCGDNGAGYLNPTQLLPPRDPSGLPNGSERWIAQCRRWFRLLDIRSVGFIINGNAGPITDGARDVYRSFAGDGIVELEMDASGNKMVGSMPVISMKSIGLPDDPAAAATEIGSFAKLGTASFIPVRSVLKSPSYYRDIERSLRRDHAGLNAASLNPAEFFYLYRHSLGGKNEHRAAFVWDTLPETIQAGEVTTQTVWIRNVGWETWGGEEATRHSNLASRSPSVSQSKSALDAEAPLGKRQIWRSIERDRSGDLSYPSNTESGANPRVSPVWVSVQVISAGGATPVASIALPRTVAPGELVAVSFPLAAPAQPGECTARVDLVAGDSVAAETSIRFSDDGNPPLERTIRVLIGNGTGLMTK